MTVHLHSNLVSDADSLHYTSDMLNTGSAADDAFLFAT